MKKITVFISVLLLFCCFVSAGAAADAEMPAHTDATILANCGDMILISAVGNPTTGYTWSEPEVSNGLEIAFSDYTQAKPDMIGTGGFFEWGVIAEKPGIYLFKTEYNRAWEKPPQMTLKALFIYLPEFLDVPDGVISLRQS